MRVEANKITQCQCSITNRANTFVKVTSLFSFFFYSSFSLVAQVEKPERMHCQSIEPFFLTETFYCGLPDTRTTLLYSRDWGRDSLALVQSARKARVKNRRRKNPEIHTVAGVMTDNNSIRQSGSTRRGGKALNIVKMEGTEKRDLRIANSDLSVLPETVPLVEFSS